MTGTPGGAATDADVVGGHRLVRVGDDGWLVRVSDAEHAASLAVWVRDHGLDCADVVPAAASVLVDGVRDAAALRRLVERWRPGGGAGRSGPVVEVPVTYDGPDLAAVALHWGVTPAEAVARHTSIEFVATFAGFAPGFSYLGGLPARWAVPRLVSPRERVAPGSVGVADRWCGIYPTASPGGWSLLGRTDLPMWDLTRERDPALLTPGTRVRFVVA